MKNRFLMALLAALFLTSPTFGQGHAHKPIPPDTKVSLFGIQEQRQIMLLQQQLQAQQAAANAANAAQIAALQTQIAQQNQMMMAYLMQQQKAAPSAPALPPINIYLPPNAPYQGPKLDPSPGTPKLDPSPGTPKLDPNPGTPKIDPNPGIPKVDPNPGTPKMDPNPGSPVAPPVGYQRYTDAPPIITGTITDRYGVTRPAPPVVWRQQK